MINVTRHHRLWKRLAIHYAHPRSGEFFLDLAGGTGDLTQLLANIIGEKGSVLLADINHSNDRARPCDV